MPHSNTRRAVCSLLLTAALFGVLVLVLARDRHALMACLCETAPGQLLLVLGVGLLYQLLDAAACWLLIRDDCPSFTYAKAVEMTFLAMFAAVTTFSAGIGPLQSYYLHRCGLRGGEGLGFSLFEYILHKLSVLLFAAAMLAAALGGFREGAALVRSYLVWGFAAGGGITAGLLLLCLCRPLHGRLLRLAAHLPQKGRAAALRQAVLDNLEALSTTTRALLRQRRRCVQVVAVSLLKLAVLAFLPLLSLHAVGFDGLSIGQSEILGAFMLLLAGVLPNAAGMGSAEFAFVQLFSPFAGQTPASAAMLLYRAATYFFPFLLSVGVFWRVRRRWAQEDKAG